ncbi:lytic transglycosylase domain-containing protein [Actinoplanes sp. NPDC049596]|uniref:aggregation-promoting factor C-terminal-like domain-containing protein n=1 Tax=unclassified Actinoplanes TaxID=2626549 RepID=UPI0034219870
MNRLWSRVGVRVTAVGLLVAGGAGGVYLGQDREVQQTSAEAQLVVQANVDDDLLLKQRQAAHAADRAQRSQAEAGAAEQAAQAAKASAAQAHSVEQKAIATKKAAEAKKKADEAKKKAEEAAKKAEEAKEEDGGGSSSGPTEYTGEIPASCDEYSGARATGCALMIQAGFGIDQFPCLDKLWKKESGWNYKATNPSSGAFGIPQALPGSKMASEGSDWKTNPATQIKWGLGYIEGRYDTPCGAWGHSQDTGWY